MTTERNHDSDRSTSIDALFAHMESMLREDGKIPEANADLLSKLRPIFDDKHAFSVMMTMITFLCVREPALMVTFVMGYNSGQLIMNGVAPDDEQWPTTPTKYDS